MSARPSRGLEDLRSRLFSEAEPANGEERTAAILEEHLSGLDPDELLTGVGGHGVVAVFRGEKEGRTLLLRADMDALPIPRMEEVDGEEVARSCSHRCGHDGHMTILAGVAARLSERRPAAGKIVLVFQPAEETGEGATRVIADARFAALGRPDLAFALHNLPGFELGSIITRRGVFAAASRGLVVEIAGATSHAAEPHRGRSPAMAVSQMIQAFDSAGQYYTGLEDASKVTVIHASLGEPGEFGTSPGTGVVMATLRSHDDGVMSELMDRCSSNAKGICEVFGLSARIGWTQEFDATVNSPEAVDIIEGAAAGLDLPVVGRADPFPWSEDFGRFTGAFTGAMFGLGSGVGTPALHNPDYEFPDPLIPIGISMFERIVRSASERGDV